LGSEFRGKSGAVEWGVVWWMGQGDDDKTSELRPRVR
jgi:hypothetical protein